MEKSVVETKLKLNYVVSAKKNDGSTKGERRNPWGGAKTEKKKGNLREGNIPKG